MGILANWKKVVTVDKIFEIPKSVHEGARAHTGYHKLFKDIEQTYLQYNKKVSKSNAKIEKGGFVTVRIPIVDRTSGDLPRLLCRFDDIIGKGARLYKLSCEFGVLNSCYGMGE